jgi:hypothetical protein
LITSHTKWNDRLITVFVLRFGSRVPSTFDMLTASNAENAQ